MKRTASDLKNQICHWCDRPGKYIGKYIASNVGGVHTYLVYLACAVCRRSFDDKYSTYITFQLPSFYLGFDGFIFEEHKEEPLW